MRGRDREKLKNALLELLARFKIEVQNQNPNRSCRITAEFHEIDPELLLAAQ